MYEELSQIYDRFVNWQERLNYEMPFIERTFAPLRTSQANPLAVLDAACGTGWHAIALAQRRYQVLGVDLSRAMIERARQNARQQNAPAHFIQAGFGEIVTQIERADPDIPRPPFDAVLCLGNSLPHTLNPEALHRALEDFAACLRPAGVLIIQNRNFDALLRRQERWLEPQSFRTEQEEFLFIRFYDFLPDGLLSFNFITLKRQGESVWQQEVHSALLYPIQEKELRSALSTTGFEQVEAYGNMQGDPFDPEQSSNLVVVCQRKRRFT